MIINSAEQLESIISSSISEVETLLAEHPGFQPYLSIHRQLIAIREWTSDEIGLTKARTQSITLGRITVHELENNPDSRVARLADALHGINYYIKTQTP